MISLGERRQSEMNRSNRLMNRFDHSAAHEACLEAAACLSISRTTKTKKSVQFSKHVRGILTLSRSQYTESEKNASYYTNQETRHEALREVRRVKDLLWSENHQQASFAEADDDDATARGFEHLLNTQSVGERKRRVAGAVGAVLAEQAGQRRRAARMTQDRSEGGAGIARSESTLPQTDRNLARIAHASGIASKVSRDEAKISAWRDVDVETTTLSRLRVEYNESTNKDNGTGKTPADHDKEESGCNKDPPRSFKAFASQPERMHQSEPSSLSRVDKSQGLATYPKVGQRKFPKMDDEQSNAKIILARALNQEMNLITQELPMEKSTNNHGSCAWHKVVFQGGRGC